LAGGKGERLLPLTKHLPKPMAVIKGRPFLEHQLKLIRQFGFKDIVLLVGYLGRHVQDYFGDGKKINLRIKYSFEKKLLGTAGALKHAERKLEDEFLLLNGDTYLVMDYSRFIKEFRKHRLLGMVAVYRGREKNLAKNIAVNGADLITGYNKTDPRGMSHVDSGVMVFKKDILDLIPQNAAFPLEKLFCRLIRMKQLAGYRIRRRFYDMGSPSGLMLVRRKLP